MEEIVKTVNAHQPLNFFTSSALHFLQFLHTQRKPIANLILKKFDSRFDLRKEKQKQFVHLFK